MSAQAGYSQYLTAEDSLALSHILSREGEVQLRLNLNNTEDGNLLFADLKTSDNAHALEFDNTLPFIRNVSEEAEENRLALHRVYSASHSDKEPSFKNKAEIDWEQWMKKNSDISPGHTVSEAFKLKGMGRPGVAGNLQHIGLNTFFTKSFWDFKGSAQRKKTIEVLRTYGDSLAISAKPIIEQ